MAAVTGPSKLLDRVATVAGGVTGIVGRIYEGKKVIAEATTLETDVKALTAETQGYFSVYVGSRAARGQLKMGQVRICALLTYNLPDEVDSTRPIR